MEMFIKRLRLLIVQRLYFFIVIAKLTVSWDLTVVYIIYFFWGNFPLSFSPSVDLRNFTGITFYFFSTFAQLSYVQIFSLSSLLFSCVHHARYSWAGNARQTMKWKPIADLCRELKFLIFPSNYSKELPHTRNDCSAACKTKRRSERRQQNVLQNVELTFNEIKFARFLVLY